MLCMQCTVLCAAAVQYCPASCGMSVLSCTISGAAVCLKHLKAAWSPRCCKRHCKGYSISTTSMFWKQQLVLMLNITVPAVL